MKDIPGYEGRYAVTKDGRIWSYPKPVTGRAAGGSPNKMRRGRWLKNIPRYGYWAVGLGATNVKLVHRLVAMTYIDNPDRKPCINHINGKKGDNRVENLEWSTRAENNSHARRTGLTVPYRKLRKDDAAKMRAEYLSGVPAKVLAARYGVTRSTVQRAVAGGTGYGDIAAPPSSLDLVHVVRITAATRKKRTYNGGPAASKYKGVSWNRKADKWYASITIDRKRKHLGSFETEEAAAAAYRMAAVAAFGEYAVA